MLYNNVWVGLTLILEDFKILGTQENRWLRINIANNCYQWFHAIIYDWGWVFNEFMKF